jgi:hypothetical protein
VRLKKLPKYTQQLMSPLFQCSFLSFIFKILDLCIFIPFSIFKFHMAISFYLRETKYWHSIKDSNSKRKEFLDISIIRLFLS